MTRHEHPLLMGSSVGCLDLSHQWPKLGGSEPRCWHWEGAKSGSGERAPYVKHSWRWYLTHPTSSRAGLILSPPCTGVLGVAQGLGGW